MAVVQSPPIDSTIWLARSSSDQVNRLRAAKDEIVGHSQQKESYVKEGLLGSLVQILYSCSPTTRNGDDSSEPRPLSDDERVHLIALELISSFASGKYHHRILCLC